MAHFTIAERPHRRRNQTRRFLKIAASTMLSIDGVKVAGCRGDFHIGDGYRVTIAEDGKHPYWWLWGNGITPVDVTDPVDAVAVLRRRHLIPERAA
jgi:hypothetical protein